MIKLLWIKTNLTETLEAIKSDVILAGYPSEVADRLIQRLSILRGMEGPWTFEGSSHKGYSDIRFGGRTYKIHRILCHAYYGPPPTSLHQACHNDGDPTNNNPLNLRWDTRKGNFADKIKHGTHNKGSRHPLAMLDEDIIPEIRKYLSQGMQQKAVGELFGVSRQCIASIAQGRSWTHV